MVISWNSMGIYGDFGENHGKTMGKIWKWSFDDDLLGHWDINPESHFQVPISLEKWMEMVFSLVISCGKRVFSWWFHGILRGDFSWCSTLWFLPLHSYPVCYWTWPSSTGKSMTFLPCSIANCGKRIPEGIYGYGSNPGASQMKNCHIF